MSATRAVAALALLLAACATHFEKPADGANYGRPPDDYMAQIAAHLENELFDPFSAVFEYSEPLRAYANKGLAYGGKIDCYGWVVDFKVNAKNRLGAYVGWTYYTAFFCEGRRPWIFDVSKGKQPALHRVD